MGFLHPNSRLITASLNLASDFVVLEQQGQPPGSGLPFHWGTRYLRVRSGAGTDGLSGPKWIKFDLQSTNSAFPAVAHDGGYQGNLEESLDHGLTWQPISLPRSDYDQMLFDLCVDNFVPAAEAKLFFVAVAEFGQQAWDADAPMRERNLRRPDAPTP